MSLQDSTRTRALHPEHDIAAARTLFPWLVTWGAVIGPPIMAGFVAACASWICVLWYSRPLAREPRMHWTQRAAHVQRLRVALTTVWVWVAIVGSMGCFFARGALSPIPAGLPALVTITFATWILVRARHDVNQRFGNGIHKSHSRWFHTVVLDYLPLGILLAILLLAPVKLTPVLLVITSLSWLLAVFALTGGALWMAVRLGWIPHKSLAELGVDASGKDWPFQRVLILPMADANAWAFGLLGEVAVTRRTLEIMTPAELTAVLHHEARHLAEPRRHHLLRLLPIVGFACFAWSRIVLAYTSPLFCAVAVLASAFLLKRIGKNLNQESEDEADRHGGKESPADYARALEKLHQANLAPVTQIRRTAHADLYDRMRATGVEPEWPRPEPLPQASKVFLYGTSFTVALLFFLYLDYRERPKRHPEETTIFHVAFGGHNHRALSVFADRAWEERDWERALVLYRAAAALAPDEAYELVCSTSALIALDRCADAVVEFAEAERRITRGRGQTLDAEWLSGVRRSVDRCRDEAR